MAGRSGVAGGCLGCVARPEGPLGSAWIGSNVPSKTGSEGRQGRAVCMR